ncbi:MAG: NERD domain-containing protein [bacterium]|nr:NERD domain-containing protein [bacterium]
MTDVLCLSEHGIFLFETKSIAVYSTDPSRTSGRRLKNLHKQVKKALSQLKGAINSIKNGYDVISKSGNQINLNRKNVLHAIVVVSELIPLGDWKEIVNLAENLFRETQCMVHIVDLEELYSMVVISKQKRLFDYNLMKRFEVLIKEKTIFIRSKSSG